MTGKAACGEERKFVADAMLGKLATWMRILGFDVAYERDMEDPELVSTALRQGRTILTRDTLLVKRRSVRGQCLFIEGDHFFDQLQQVLRRFKPRRELFLTRCLRCNAPLEDVEKASVRELVPPYVYRTQERFSRCPECRRMYWAGTHRDRMLEKISKILKDAV